MAVICELGLNDVLGQLKPIAFAAEREALISDQLDAAAEHWSKVRFNCIVEVERRLIANPKHNEKLVNY